eukprot:GSA120T00024504001.1
MLLQSAEDPTAAHGRARVAIRKPVRGGHALTLLAARNHFAGQGEPAGRNHRGQDGSSRKHTPGACLRPPNFQGARHLFGRRRRFFPHIRESRGSPRARAAPATPGRASEMAAALPISRAGS